MDFSVGIDIEDIGRFKLVNNNFIEKVLVPEEFEQYILYPHKQRFLASRFSVKEAVKKAFSDFGKNLVFTDIVTATEENGALVIKKVKYSGFQIKVSLSHSRTTTVAVALVIKLGPHH